MEVLRIVGITLGCIQALLALLDTSKKLALDLATGLAFLKEDLDMIKGHLEQNKELHLQPQMELKLQELAYDIDDFVQGLSIPGPWGGFVRSAMRLDIRQEHIDRMVYFKSCAENLEKKLEKSSESMKTGSGTTSGTTGVCDAPMIKEKDLVGIAKPKEEISDLLFRSDGPLRVISIVGCSGLGKTALASAIYHDPKIECEFDFTAWVVASKDSPAGILEKILEAAGLASPNGSTSKASQHIPRNKRYLFFLDDVQQKGIIWIDIKEAFSENDMGSRIILTTRAPSVAAACSPGGYIYNMKCLGKDESKVLLWTNAINCGEEPAAFAKDSEHIYLKCGGLPLALISAGQCLSVKGLDLDRDYCYVVGETLGDYLVDDNKVAFPEMRRALVQCYDKLPNQDHRNCLLYASIFPRGYQINSNSLARKLIAEELVDNDGRICWDELIDRSMIEEVRDDSKVATERCKVHSIMLEFAIKKAVARNFVSLIHEGKLQHNPHGRVRRLTLQPGHNVSRGGVKEEVDLSSLRSLTIFDSGILDFKSCRVIRILDLEGCSWLNKKVVDEICELVFIKYLSLRKTGIATLPKEVRKLKCLETLDIRETEVKTLPLRVIILPKLAFLFGRFEVPNLSSRDSKMLKKFLEKESKLHTLAGVVVNKKNSFETIILHARRLEKVKIWFEVAEPVGGILVLAGSLVSSLQKRFQDLESVSINFSGLSNDFMGSLQPACIISSIKLWGKVERLPESDVLSQLGNLRKLHLFSTRLSVVNLALLQNLHGLEFLKLLEDEDGSWDGEFVVQAGGFPNLHFMCFEAPKLPRVVFEQGSMVSLNSLQLHCPGFPAECPRGVEDISLLEKLKEVILHHSAPVATVKAWKDAAKLHTNRPHVKQQIRSQQ